MEHINNNIRRIYDIRSTLVNMQYYIQYILNDYYCNIILQQYNYLIIIIFQ